MAGDWIKYVKGLHECPEVAGMAERLGVNVYEVVGRLMRLWDYLDGHFECDVERDADLILCNATVTLRALRVCADCAQTFVDALAEVGWMVRDGDTIRLVRWGRHNGKSGKSRALGHMRVKRCRNASVTRAALPEKRREEESINTPPNPPLQGGNGEVRVGRIEKQAARKKADSDRAAAILARPGVRVNP